VIPKLKMFAKPFIRNIKALSVFRFLEGIGRKESGLSHQEASPNNSCISSVGFSLLVGPLTQSGSINIFLYTPMFGCECVE
jgi:hypothetical protein